MKKLVEILENRESLSKINLEYFDKLRASLLETLGHRNLPLDFNKKQGINEDPVTDIVFLCRAYLGCKVLLLSSLDREEVKEKPQKLGRGAFLEF